MAKKDKNEAKSNDVSVAELTKGLIKSFNGNGPKIAWSLGMDEDNPTDVKEFIPTGSTLLNYIISNRENGGWPVGKISEIAGEEASGKSLLLAHAFAETQKRGGIAVYMDTENSANPDFLTRIGVNVNQLVYMQPSCCEEVGEKIIETITMIRAKAPNALVTIGWDGIAATPVRKELEGDFDLSMDVQLEKSKVLSKMMRKITDMLGKDRVCLLITNQLKTKIGVMYGDPMTTPGGKAVPYHASVRLRLFAGQKQKTEKPKKGAEVEAGKSEGDIYGIHTSAKVVKNRLGPPFRKCEFDILFASGIDDVSSWFQRLHECGEVEKAEGWCYLTSFPSGKIETKGVNEGKDRGFSFREREFPFILKDPDNSKLLAHVKELIKKNMIVKYGERPRDFEMDEESLMDAEEVQRQVMSGEINVPVETKTEAVVEKATNAS